MVRKFAIFSLLIGFIVLPITGQVLVRRAARVPPAAAAGSYFFEETFEAALFDNQWATNTGGGPLDPDDTTFALAGSESLSLTPSTFTYCWGKFDAQDEIYGKTMVKIIGEASTPEPILLANAGVGVGLKVRFDNAARKWVIYNGGSDTTGTSTITTNTLYYVWYYYKKGTGANGISAMWYNTVDTYPGGAPECSRSNGTSTLSITNFVTQCGSGAKIIIDNVRLSTTFFE